MKGKQEKAWSVNYQQEPEVIGSETSVALCSCTKRQRPVTTCMQEPRGACRGIKTCLAAGTAPGWEGFWGAVGRGPPWESLPPIKSMAHGPSGKEEQYPTCTANIEQGRGRSAGGGSGAPVKHDAPAAEWRGRASKTTRHMQDHGEKRSARVRGTDHKYFKCLEQAKAPGPGRAAARRIVIDTCLECVKGKRGLERK